MSNISDRQVAKTILRAYGTLTAIFVEEGVLNLDQASEMGKELVVRAAQGNSELLEAIETMMDETTEEMEAEILGRAEPAFRPDVAAGSEPKQYEAPGVSRHENWD